ncbi:MAG: cation transporter dimerization domain-containing protein [Solirubrobacteraceae bacterium]
MSAPGSSQPPGPSHAPDRPHGQGGSHHARPASIKQVVGYHELRTRRAGARRYVDLHV